MTSGDESSLERRDLEELDRADPLRAFRERFELPEGIVYLDGNSLGPPARTMAARLERLVAGEWGADLVASSNRHGWFRLPERVGARIAPLLDAEEDEVVAADSVSVNLFKLLGALLRPAGKRRVLLAEESDFPTDLYVAREAQDALIPPIRGWMGHARPFDFDAGYRPAPSIRRFLAGTPPILSMIALEEGLRTFDGVDMAEVRRKSEALGDLFLRLASGRLAAFGVSPASPLDARERGSRATLRHPDAWPAMQALIARGVVGDFREPDLLRFGFAPLYVRYVDVWDAVEALRLVLSNGEHREARHRRRNEVT